MNQMTTLTKENPQACHLNFHLILQQKNIVQLQIMKQMNTLPVDIPQDCRIHSYLTCHWIILYQIHHLRQVNIPLEIPQVF